MRAGAGSGEQKRTSGRARERSPRHKDGKFTYLDSSAGLVVFSGFFPQQRADIAAEDAFGPFGVDADGLQHVYLGIEYVTDPTPREEGGVGSEEEPFGSEDIEGCPEHAREIDFRRLASHPAV